MAHQQFNLPSREERERNQPVVPDFELKAPNILRTDKDLNIKNTHTVTDNETTIRHGQRMKLTEVVSGAAQTHFTQLSQYTIGIKDVVVSRGVQLPRASLAGIGKLYVIKDMSGSASATTIAISPLDGELIDGEPDDTINTDFGQRRYYCDGSAWFSW